MLTDTPRFRAAPGLITKPVISKKGLVLNMGSFAGAAPTPMLAVYSASKSFLRTWSEGLAAELSPKGVVVEHVNTYYVVRPLPSPSYSEKIKLTRVPQTSAMSKIRRPSLFIPTPKAFVRTVLAKIAPGTITPYWAHALVSAAMGLAPSKVVLAYTHALLKNTRRRALAKQAKLAKQE
jgi:17beta-estradiol 17-dehydrogenase / very-long-chain 3-oxoacyl-CoA reductase